jgi:hypothetical protein
MSGRLDSWAMPGRTLLLSAVVSVVMVAPIVAAYLVAGTPAALSLAMGLLVTLRSAITLRPFQALALVVPAAMAGAVAVGLRGQPLAAACFVALCCLLVAPAGMLQDSLMAAVPSAAAVLVMVPGDFQPGPTAAWMLAGGALLVAVATRLPRSAPSPGVEQHRAWRHATVMAVSVGAVVFLVDTFQVPHGYWVALTLTVVLGPFDDRTLTKASQRVLGTIGGALLALVAATLLPLWALLALLVISTVLSVGYALTQDYTRQVMFMTPAVVLLGSAASNPGLIASERALATLAGALLAAAIALGLATFENRRAVVAP